MTASNPAIHGYALGAFHLHGKITLAVGKKTASFLGSVKTLQNHNAHNHKKS